MADEPHIQPNGQTYDSPEGQPPPIRPPSIDSSTYGDNVIDVRKPRRFSFSLGMTVPVVLVIALGFATSGPADPAFSAIDPKILFLMQFMVLNVISLGGVFVLRNVLKTNVLEYGVGMPVSICIICCIGFYISH